jgi:hypothetical protein
LLPELKLLLPEGEELLELRAGPLPELRPLPKLRLPPELEV